MTTNLFGKYVYANGINLLTLVFICGFRDYIFNEVDPRALEMGL
jgi:hypothetical protein